jgi:hypothetical protein
MDSQNLLAPLCFMTSDTVQMVKAQITAKKSWLACFETPVVIFQNFKILGFKIEATGNGYRLILRRLKKAVYCYPNTAQVGDHHDSYGKKHVADYDNRRFFLRLRNRSSAYTERKRKRTVVEFE